MKLLLSLTYKHFEVNPQEFINILKREDKDKIIKGFEISVKFYEDKIFLKELARICKNEEYILRLHAPNYNNVSEYKQYFDFVNEIVNLYGDNINVVFHTITGASIEENKIKTIEFLEQIFEYLENNEYNKITISIENLNDLENYKRLKRDKIKDILVKYPKLKFTYDIGHELIDGNLQLSLSEIFLERINNVHVHIFEGKEDHYPII